MARRRRVAEEAEQQTFLEGVTSEKIPAVHRAALRYAKRRDERIAYGVEEKSAAEKLSVAMKEAGIEEYHHGPVHVTHSEKFQVRIEGPATEEE